MKLQGLNLSDLSTYQHQLDLVKLTAEQLTKDFEIFGYEINFSGKNNTAYLELTEQIKPIISQLLNNNSSKLMSLMYKIDLSEAQVRNIMADSNTHEVVSKITHIILERELKKVVIKQYFKNKENQA